VRVIHNIIYPSPYDVIGRLNSIGKTPKHFYSLYYPQRKNPAKAFDNLFIMEEAVAGTSAVAPLDDLDDGIDVDNLIDSIDPIGAPFDPSTPNTEIPTSITCNPNRSPRDKSIRDMVNKEDASHDGYDSDGELGPFYNRTDKEGQQLFNEDDDDDDGVGFVAERAIHDETGVGADTDGADTDADVGEEEVTHVPIDLDTLNGMNLNQLKNELKLRQQSVYGVKFKLKE
jgi:hypothetical protein